AMRTMLPSLRAKRGNPGADEHGLAHVRHYDAQVGQARLAGAALAAPGVLRRLRLLAMTAKRR
ncbi:MAG TPA: hypothetical protein VHD15_01470, partial [Hyphomicrobiales bacterium]|nr:hypothetical protein [Hyphomicrobiales bacterium]